MEIFMQKRKYFNIFWFFVLILILVIIIPQLAELSLQDLLSYTPKSPVLAALGLIGLYLIKAFVMFIPLTVLYIAAGVIFPVSWAIVLTYFCLMIETSIGFFLGRGLGHKRVHALADHNERAKKIMEFSTNNSVLSCFVLRLIPGPPIELTNMLVGTTDIKYHHFILGTLLGYTPGMIPLVLMGGAATDPLSDKFLIPLACSIIITSSIVGGYLWWKKIKRKQ